MSYDRIYAHIPDPKSPVIAPLKDKGVNVLEGKRFGDEKYCNKISQVDSVDRFIADGGDFVFLCDCDLAFASPVGDMAPKSDVICGKTVDFPNPRLDKIIELLNAAGFDDLPPPTRDTLTHEPTLRGNLNGGIYGIPVKWLREFGDVWKQIALDLLNCPQRLEILGPHAIHVDQMSFCMALHSTGYPLEILPLTYNCPTHVPLPMSGRELTERPLILHYHDNLDDDGRLGPCGTLAIDAVIQTINENIEPLSTSMLLKSSDAPESSARKRSETVVKSNQEALRHLLVTYGICRSKSTLDFRCGTASHILGLDISNYKALEPREREAHAAARRYPNLEILNQGLAELENDDGQYEIVLCTDLFAAEAEGEDINALIAALAARTQKRLIVVGPDVSWTKDSTIPGDFRSLTLMMEETGRFAHVYKAGNVGGGDVLIGECDFVPQIGKQGAKNDMDDALLASAIASSEFGDALVECVSISRAVFGWYTEHTPRLFEYPWLLSCFGSDLRQQRIGDLGAGLSALPFALANRGADVRTVDSHTRIVSNEGASQFNEWGFYDYGKVHSRISSLNAEMRAETYEPRSFDAWYSISVIEHMPADIRRNLIKVIATTLKPGGKLYLTLDLEKRSQDLWILNEGKAVEARDQHGTLSSIVQELRAAGFAVGTERIMPLPLSLRVDLGFLEATLYSAPLCKEAVADDLAASPPRASSDARWKERVKAVLPRPVIDVARPIARRLLR
ncbi:hypothetical protein AUC68_12815 [Methyloceanibacter methanicus]|uniref:Methyltransferase type 11 domain-containing protein n=1 Tax=Methyloceanibacter methanicus TaxID=1774968 RepID=A0A1E3W651_9HYPH|nr:class I SAM-dependent methyltransferase [Methyloceanibacter methanicus]ODS01236.1 hypothetical protein AUC68_12815 [Methyloceanibacter methanicus]